MNASESLNCALPPELLLHIFSYLDEKGRSETSRVCKHFYQLMQDSVFIKQFVQKKFKITLQNQEYAKILLNTKKINQFIRKGKLEALEKACKKWPDYYALSIDSNIDDRALKILKKHTKVLRHVSIDSSNNQITGGKLTDFLAAQKCLIDVRLSGLLKNIHVEAALDSKEVESLTIRGTPDYKGGRPLFDETVVRHLQSKGKKLKALTLDIPETPIRYATIQSLKSRFKQLQELTFITKTCLSAEIVREVVKAMPNARSITFGNVGSDVNHLMEEEAFQKKVVLKS